MKITGLLIVAMITLLDKGYGQKSIDLSYYLNNKEISRTAKDFYDKKFAASDDKRTFSILDSLNTRNDATRPFYIYLVSMMMKRSDGALSEALGTQCNDFIESHPNLAMEFLYSTDGLSSPGFIDLWADAIAGEFMIVCEGKEKKCIEESYKKLLLKCKPGNKTNLAGFYKKVANKIH